MSVIAASFLLRRQGFLLDVALEIPAAGVTAVFGPSGSGKTTLLRCIAGLERVAHGRLEVDGDCWQDAREGRFLPPHRRGVGYVFQDAALLPHLTVEDNLRYGWRRVPPARRRIDVADCIARLGLASLLHRYPSELSGGERQRVALARALLLSPRLLLLDEPLAALDAAAKADILPYLEHLPRELAIPAIYVTHAVDEVARLADHVVVLNQGQVRARAPVLDMLTRLDLPLAASDDAGTVIDATVVDYDPLFHLARLRFEGGELLAVRKAAPIGRHVRVRILARDVSIALDPPGRTSILNVLPARVSAISEISAGQWTVRLDANGTPLLARITRKSGVVLDLREGAAVFAQVKSIALFR